MAIQDTDVLVSIGAHSWCFPGAEIDLDSEFEWRGDDKLYLHDGIGNVVEETELSDAEMEQLAHERAASPGDQPASEGTTR